MIMIINTMISLYLIVVFLYDTAQKNTHIIFYFADCFKVGYYFFHTK